MKPVVMGLALVFGSLAARAELAIGDPAPPISVKEWVKGGPLDLGGKQNKVFVIQFWATWHEASRETIPHMTELQRKYRDRGVVVVGLTDEAPSLVKTFVQQMGPKLDYAVGIDEGEKAFKAYMEPFGQETLPYAFVIDQEGRLVWHGHPLGSLAKAVEELTTGKFNLEFARKHDRNTKLQFEYIKLVNTPATRPKAAELGNTIITELGNDASGLNSFAWRILTDRRVKYRDVALALKSAKRAHELGGSTEAAIVDTYARALFENGQKEAAIEQQKAAIKLAKEEGQRIEYESTLKKYQRLLRESRN